MKISKFSICNFKCLGPQPVEFDFSDDILVLIGENNTGKSSVLSALFYFFSGTKTIPVEYFHNKQSDQSHAIVITTVFSDLSSEDKAHQAVSSYISSSSGDDSWILQKRYYYTDDGKGKCDYIALVNNEEKPNPSGLSQNCDDLFTEEKMQKIYVEAVQNISEIAGGGSKTAFGQIFNLLLKSDLEDATQFKELISAFENYAALFKKNTQHPKVAEIETQITEKLGRFIPAKSVLDADVPKIEKLLPTPSISADDGRQITTNPENQGNGFQRALIFTLLELLAEAKSPVAKAVGPRNLLLIEEPELYMHPQMIRKVTNALYEIAKDQKAQVIVTTHSPQVLKIFEKQKALVRLIRTTNNELLTIQQNEEIFAEGNAGEAKERLQMIMRFDSTVNELFFARRVVLLEGDSEYVAIKESGELLESLWNESTLHNKFDTTLINCRSRDTIPFFQKILNHFKIDYVVIHDLEGEDVSTGVNGRILNLLGNVENKRKTFPNDIEQFLGISLSARDSKPLKVYEKVKELSVQNLLNSKMSDFVKFAYNIT